MTGKKHFKTQFLITLLSLSCVLAASCGIPGNRDVSQGEGTSQGEGISQGENAGNAAVEAGNTPGSGNPTAGSRQAQGIVYLPSFREMTGSESGSCRSLEYNCGFLYYSVMSPDADGQNRRNFYRQNLANGISYSPAQQLYQDSEAREELATDTYSFFTDAKGYGYFILRGQDANTEREQYSLCKYGVSGTELFRRDITAQMTARPETEDSSLFRRALTDGESRIYIGLTGQIYLYDKEGNLQAKAPVPGELAGMDCGRDGAVYVTYRTDRELALGRVDFEKGIVEEIYVGFPGDGALYGGTEYDILTMDSQKVYGFTPGMEAPETVLHWMDSDLYGSEISYLHGLDEGMLLGVFNGSDMRPQLVFLTPPKTDSAPAKELITIGVLHHESCQALDTLVAAFNRNSGHYRAELLIYGRDSKDLTDLQAVLDRANMAIMSGDSPDLICLYYGVNVDAYVNRGILEDLTDYLSQSDTLHREALLEPALEQFTYDDGLYGLPRDIILKTLAGRRRDLGDERGWTIAEMKQFAQGHPDARLFDYARLFDPCPKNGVLRVLLEYNMKNYVDWGNGTCSFDSEEFRELLEFANSFPLAQLPDKDLTLENGGILLYLPWQITDVHSYTYMRKAFGNEDITCIGFPGQQGNGTMIDIGECTFGISTLSAHKDGAWAFMEFMMTAGTIPEWNFPVNKEMLERNFLDALGQDYVYDGEGNIRKDENGKPLTRELFAERSGLAPTQEDVDAIRQLLDTAQPSNLSRSNIYNIISEEVSPYFYGQKTLDQVVDIIQRRAQLYVSESQ